MNVRELAVAAQNLSFEQRKELIKEIFAQLPKTESLVGSVVQIGDLEAGSKEINEHVTASIQRSAVELQTGS